MKPKVNVHCHLFNFPFIPAKMVKRLSNIPEAVADDRWLANAASVLFALVPGNKYDRVKKYLNNLNKDISLVAIDYHTELCGVDKDSAGFHIYTPLMMNLEETPALSGEYTCKYVRQVELMSTLAIWYPWQMFPFVMFDPRQEHSDSLCINALENLGFLGVKMYPALGYCPDPVVVEEIGTAGHGSAPNVHAGRRMRRLYDYCVKENVPITVHASTGGAYSTDVEGNRKLNAWPLSDPANWTNVLEQWALTINFAHFGGDYLTGNNDRMEKSIEWRKAIQDLIKRSQTNQLIAKVYADLSYHDMALQDRGTSQKYFKDLRQLLDDPIYRERILFGTDASMISHTYSEKEYADVFINGLSLDHTNRIFTQNPINFLFTDKAFIPDRYVSFLESVNRAEVPAGFEWIRKTATNGYKIIFP